MPKTVNGWVITKVADRTEPQLYRAQASNGVAYRFTTYRAAVEFAKRN